MLLLHNKSSNEVYDMGDSYEQYLPHIDMADGIKRVVNNKKLYLRLVGKFDGKKMIQDIVENVKAKDHTKSAHATHALRGTASNLGFTHIGNIASEIENLCKKEEDASHLLDSLIEAGDILTEKITQVLAEG